MNLPAPLPPAEQAHCRRTAALSELLAKLQELGRGGDPDPDDPEGGGPVYHITYAPQYCFEGGAPSREDMTDAEHISQEEFERRMNQWMKDNARKRF